MELKELLEQRAGLIANMREMIDARGNKTFSAEDREKMKKMEVDFDDVTATIEIIKGQNERERAMQAPFEAPVRPQPGSGGDTGELKAEEILDAFGRSLAAGIPNVKYAPFQDKHKQVLQAALQTDVDTGGGYLVPKQFVLGLIQAVDDMLWIRRKANIIRTNGAESLGAVSLDSDPDDADWTSEIGEVQEDTGTKFGGRELKPNQLSKLIKISRKLISSAAIPIEQFIIQRLAYKFAVTEEKHYMTGNGAKQPLGVFTASNDGISTSRDVSTGNTATEIKADNLIEVKYSVKSGYWNSADWLFHRDGMKQIVKLKDSNNQYIFRESLRAGEPDILLGHPIMISEFAPNTFTTGKYVGLFGDFSFYWIADSLSMEMQRLIETYAKTNQVGFIGRKETDGQPVLEEAFARVKLA